MLLLVGVYVNNFRIISDSQDEIEKRKAYLVLAARHFDVVSVLVILYNYCLIALNKKTQQFRSYYYNYFNSIQPYSGISLDVAQQNEQELIVDGILAHRGNHYRRSTMEFLVQWAGYD